MILHNCRIVTMNEKREIYDKGAILIEGNRVLDLGRDEDMRVRYEKEYAKGGRDLEGALVIPGLVDCHVHMQQAISRSAADDIPLKDFLEKRVWPLQAAFTPDDARVSAELNILEMLKSGTTTFLECMIAGHYDFDNIARTVADTGIRACLSRIVMDDTGYAGGSKMSSGMVESKEAGLSDALDMLDKWHGQADGRIQVWFGPRSTGSCTKELLSELAVLAQEKETGITMHFAQGTRAEVDYIRQHFGCEPYELLEETGLYGPNVSLVHCVWLEEDDIDFLARTNTNVVHCPSSNSKIGMGVAPIPEMLAKGVNVTLGCDGGPSNNTYDMIRELKMAACIHKATKRDPEVMPVESILEMATINGARSLGLDKEIGSLEVGKKADLVVLDLNKPHLTPSTNALSTLVFCALGSDVSSVMVDGVWLVEDGRVLSMDEDRILSEVNARAKDLFARTGVDIQTDWPIL